ncbi:MAG: antibiotic biosynthesis monooxygenase [Pseudonocardiaceae bacterium]
MITEGSPLVGVGARVRVARKLVPDLTQQRLADRAHVSVSLVKAVEQGRVPATAAFVAAVLGMTVYDLWGQPNPRYGQERAGVTALETAVIAGPALVSDNPPSPLDELATRVDEITRLYDRCRFSMLMERAPGLLEDLHTAAAHQAPGADAERAQQLLTISYDRTRRCLHALVVRFELNDEESAAAFDRLVAETGHGIEANEPGTLVYVTHRVEGAPLSRLFYEVYRDHAAFEEHERQPHTQRFLIERGKYVASKRVEFVSPITSKGLPAG